MADLAPLVVAVDGGQSSTLALAAAVDGRIVGVGRAGPSNHIDEPGGKERLENALRQSVAQALAAAQQPAAAVISACLGMTGAPDAARAIARQLLPRAAVQAHYDMVTALAGASSARPGAVVIAGTGSIAYGRLADGREARAGGWGYIMGDEGSGYDIGLAALRAASQASDGRAGPTALLQRIPEHFGLSDLSAVHRAVYAGEIARPQLAALARVTAAAAAAGDDIARGLLVDAGRELARCALAVVTQLGGPAAGLAVVYPTGGVLAAGGVTAAAFREQVMAGLAGLRVEPAAFSPAVGALLLALQAAGTPLDAAALAAVRATLPAAATAKQP